MIETLRVFGLRAAVSVSTPGGWPLAARIVITAQARLVLAIANLSLGPRDDRLALARRHQLRIVRVSTALPTDISCPDHGVWLRFDARREHIFREIPRGERLG